MLKKIVLIKILLILSSNTLYGVGNRTLRIEEVFNTYSLNTCIEQDSDGFIWVGSTNGLYKYNGYNTINYNITNSALSSNTIYSIYADSGKILWIVTKNGLNSYNKRTNLLKKHTFFDKTGGSRPLLFNNNPSLIQEDNNGVIWIGTKEGLVSYNKITDKYQIYKHHKDIYNSLLDNNITTLYIDRSNNIWVGSTLGLSRFDITTKTFFHYPMDAVGDGIITTITETRDSDIIIGSSKGGISILNLLNGITNRINQDTGLSLNVVSYVYEDTFGYLWICRDNIHPTGLEYYDTTTNTLNVLTKSNSNLPSNFVLHLIEDKSGIIWFTHPNGIVSKIDSNTFILDVFQSKSDRKNTILSNNITYLTEDATKRYVWIASPPYGLSKLDIVKNTFIHYLNNIDYTNPTRYIYSLCDLDSNQLILGLSNGSFCLFDKNQGIVINMYKINNISSVITDIVVDKKNKSIIYLATDSDGIIEYNIKTNKYIHYTYNAFDTNSIPNNSITSLYQDNTNNLWICNQKGLCMYNKSTFLFTSYNTKVVKACFEDSLNNFWILTEDSTITLFDRNTLKFIPYPIVLPIIQKVDFRGIVEDNQHNLWLSSDFGLFKFNILSKKFTNNYTEKDGLPTNMCSPYHKSILSLESGLLIIVGTNGLNIINSNISKKREVIAPIHITSLSQNLSPIPTSVSLDILEYLTLEYKFNYFEFTYSILNYAKPNSNIYRYMLEGWDSDWYYASTNTTGRYSGLNEGVYRLRIQALDNSLTWSNNEKELSLYIKPKRRINYKYIDIDNTFTQTILLDYGERDVSIQMFPVNNSILYTDYLYKLDNYDKQWNKVGNKVVIHYSNLPYGNYTFKIQNNTTKQTVKSLNIVINAPFWETSWFIIFISLIIIGLLTIIFFIILTIIQKRKLELEETVKQQTESIKKQNEEMLESILYASKIQNALLPSNLLKDLDSFTIWIPKESVGGDMYLYQKIPPKNFIIGIIDCTGHGIPGAFMSMSVISVIHELLDNKFVSPAFLLNQLNVSLKQILNKSKSEDIPYDGLEIGLCYYKYSDNYLLYSGAGIHLFECTNGIAKMYKSDKHVIGSILTKNNIFYKSYVINNISHDTIFYLTSDGFLDQNSDTFHTFGVERFKNLIESVYKLPLEEQKQVILDTLATFKQTQHQRDDITIIGFRAKKEVKTDETKI